jgi:predicted solute-binding protein
VCAVSYLNTVPLVWGMMHGPQRGIFDLAFALPSECAERLRSQQADIGLPPVATLLDQDLAVYRGSGIACEGPVRTILLISKVPFSRVRTLATDSGSRTSVLLSRIILSEQYGTEPVLISRPPDLAAMLEIADATLIIGDAALRLDPVELETNGFHVADLGQEWLRMTGLPMVFAVWAGRRDIWSLELENTFTASARYGLEHIDEIARAESARRGITVELAQHYLTRNLVLELGDREYEGMRRFLDMARAIGPHEFVTATTVSGD